MSKTGMLGEQKVLRSLWDGPLGELMTRLNSENGPEWEALLKALLRSDIEFEGAVVQATLGLPKLMAPGELQQWTRNPQWLKEVLHDALVDHETTGGFSCKVSYDKPLWNLPGNSDKMNRELYHLNDLGILKNLGETPVGVRDQEFSLISFKRAMDHGSAGVRIGRMEYVPANWHDLVTFWKCHPSAFGDFEVVAPFAEWSSRSSSSWGHGHIKRVPKDFILSWVDHNEPNTQYLVRRS